MLVEFQRVAMSENQAPQGYGGEDDGLPAFEPTPLPLSVNPQYVAAITPSSQGGPNVTIIKLSDGRGYSVRGSYAEVRERLEAAGSGAITAH